MKLEHFFKEQLQSILTQAPLPAPPRPPRLQPPPAPPRLSLSLSKLVPLYTAPPPFSRIFSLRACALVRGSVGAG